MGLGNNYFNNVRLLCFIQVLKAEILTMSVNQF